MFAKGEGAMGLWQPVCRQYSSALVIQYMPAHVVYYILTSPNDWKTK